MTFDWLWSEQTQEQNEKKTQQNQQKTIKKPSAVLLYLSGRMPCKRNLGEKLHSQIGNW